jgi:hypothetical protein
MKCVYLDDDNVRSVQFAILTLSNMLRLHSGLSNEQAELLETHIRRLREIIDTAKEADDI